MGVRGPQTREQRHETIIFRSLACLTLFSVSLILTLVAYLAVNGLRPLVQDLMRAAIGTDTSQLLPLLVETLSIVIVSTLLALPLGIAAGIYLCEYVAHSRLAKGAQDTIANLANIPPIVYGLFGWGALAHGKLGASLATIMLTLSVWMLPKITAITTQALEQVPLAFRRESQALGASRWQTSIYAVLPYARRQIAADVLGAMARLSGETAPMIILVGVEHNLGLEVPGMLSYHLYRWLVDSIRSNQAPPYAAALLLLSIALLLQFLAVIIDPTRKETVQDLGSQEGRGW